MNDEWPEKPLVLTDQNFEEVVKQYPITVVDCWAPWCGPCRILEPVIIELANAYRGRVVFGKLNTDENQNIPIKHNIMSIPTILFFKNGELVNSAVGAVPKSNLEEMLNALL